MRPYIYLRAIRHVDYTVFCVQDGQKAYFDSVFDRTVAFSSGQQVKRCILESILNELGETNSPVTFNFELKTDKSFGTVEPWSPCDPTFSDQLLGGWMRLIKDKESIKRRSPFSISAMRPIHPLLGYNHKENITFDRSDKPELHPINLRDSKGRILDKEEVNKFLAETGRTLPARTWIADNKRTGGLFVYDIAIDMRTLFSVSLNQYEPEVKPEIIEKLKQQGWIESKNIFGSCLVAPRERREKLITAIAYGIINWQITSNQARTFSLMETLAIAISDNANKLAGAIRADLVEDSEKPKAKLIIDESAGSELFVSLPCRSYVAGIEASADALDKAENKIKGMLSDFDYENQLK